jgi:hypothetical protein
MFERIQHFVVGIEGELNIEIILQFVVPGTQPKSFFSVAWRNKHANGQQSFCQKKSNKNTESFTFAAHPWRVFLYLFANCIWRHLAYPRLQFLPPFEKTYNMLNIFFESLFLAFALVSHSLYQCVM